MHRHRPGALRGRAGRDRRRRRPLPRRGRPGPDRRALCAPARRRRSRSRRRAGRAPPSRRGRRQRGQPAALPLRRSGGGVCAGGPPHRDHRALPAQRLHPDRVPRTGRLLRSRHRRLRRALQLPGTAGAASGHGAGAQGAGAAAAAAGAAGFGRELRGQAGDLPLRRRHGAGRAEGRTPGQVDRGPARTPAGRDLGHQPGDPDRGRGRGGRNGRRPPPRPARGLRRLSARAGAGDPLPQPRQPHRPLPHRPSRGDQSRRPDQQDAFGPQPRLRRAAVLLRPRTADAAHRRDLGDRPARRDSPQSGAGRRLPLPRRRRGRSRLRGLPGRRRPRRRRGRPRGLAGEARGGARGGPPVRNRLRRGGRTQHFQHGLRHPGARRRRAPRRRAEGRRRRQRHGGRGPSRRRHRHRRIAAAGPGAPHGAGAGRGRIARPRTGGRDGQPRTRHAEGPLVDRGRQLFEPLLRRRGRRGASRGRTAQATPGAHRGPAARRRAGDAALPGRAHLRRRRPRARAGLPPGGRTRPLGAGEPAAGRGRGGARERQLDAARPGTADG